MTAEQEKIIELLENYIEFSKQYGYNDFEVWCEDNIDTVEEEYIVEKIYQEVNYIADKLFRQGNIQKIVVIKENELCRNMIKQWKIFLIM